MNEMKEKIRAAIALGSTKGLRVTAIGPSVGHFVYHPDGSRKRFAGATKLIAYLENYKS